MDAINFVVGVIVGVVTTGVLGVGVVWQMSAWWSRRLGLEATARVNAEERAAHFYARTMAAEMPMPMGDDDDDGFDG
jgi:hypothetical protein